MLLHSLGLSRCKTLSCGLINQNSVPTAIGTQLSLKIPNSKPKCIFIGIRSVLGRKKKGEKRRERHPYLPYFLKVQLRKCVEPIRNLANVEELDLKTKQRTGCVEDKKTFQHRVNSSRARRQLIRHYITFPNSD